MKDKSCSGKQGRLIYVTIVSMSDPFLQQTESGLELVFPAQVQWQPLRIDFDSPAWRHRRQQISWRKEQIARAVGMGKHKNLRIIDATAGLGHDSYVLALLGAQLTCVERSPVIYRLLEDAVLRAKAVGVPGVDNMTLVQSGAIDFLNDCDAVDVVYLDPMYPGREQQSALQKKSLRMIREVVGEDLDADDLLTPALAVAQKRVVVKRPKGADFLQGKEPNLQLKGSSSRFDVYLSGE